jgi:hypothetical protein
LEIERDQFRKSADDAGRKIVELRAMLERVRHADFEPCPICCSRSDEPCDPDCELAALLK